MINLKAAFAALIAVTALGLSTQVRATAYSNLDLGNPGISAFASPYGQVGITVIDSTHATVTFTSNTVGGNTYLFGGAQAFDLNVNASSFSVTNIAGTRLGNASGNPFSVSYNANNSVDGWGDFNLQIDAFDGFSHAVDFVSFSLTGVGTMWTTPGSVLDLVTTGYDAAAHVFVSDGIVNGDYHNAGATGFAAEDIGGVINPLSVPDGGSTALMLGGALGLLALGSRFKKVAVLSLLAAATLGFGTQAKAVPIVGDIELGGSVHFNTLFLQTATAVNTWVSDGNVTGFTSIQPGGTGEFRSTQIPLGTLVQMAQPWTFGTVNGGAQPSLWQVFGFNFDLASSHVDFRSSRGLIISGNGTVSHNGFDDTPMEWVFTTQNAGGGGGVFFSFSANAVSQGVPDGGGTVMLMGGALTALGLIRRFVV